MRRRYWVSVPDRETRAWLETEEYSVLVRGAIRELNLPVEHVRYEAEPEKGLANQVTATMGPLIENDTESVAAALNPKFTFETFVVGACNQFAHAAARSVATNPSRSYNRCFCTAAWVWERPT